MLPLQAAWDTHACVGAADVGEGLVGGAVVGKEVDGAAVVGEEVDGSAVDVVEEVGEEVDGSAVDVVEIVVWHSAYAAPSPSGRMSCHWASS